MKIFMKKISLFLILGISVIMLPAKAISRFIDPGELIQCVPSGQTCNTTYYLLNWGHTVQFCSKHFGTGIYPCGTVNGTKNIGSCNPCHLNKAVWDTLNEICNQQFSECNENCTASLC